jgi:hypothetical protein
LELDGGNFLEFKETRQLDVFDEMNILRLYEGGKREGREKV